MGHQGHHRGGHPGGVTGRNGVRRQTSASLLGNASLPAKRQPTRRTLAFLTETPAFPSNASAVALAFDD